MRIPDLPAVIEDLKSYHGPFEDVSGRRQLAEAGLPRLLGTIDFIPEGTPQSRLLELGAEPYLTSLVLDRVWPGEVTRTNYGAGAERRGSVTLSNPSRGTERTFEFDLFDIERDEFPYPDGTFDVVIFSELVEHLALNPVWALSEIHRVLRPDGRVVVTTPNVLSLGRLHTYLVGGSQLVDRYSPAFGPGARHNREYAPAELAELFETTGFSVETFAVRDLKEYPLAARLGRALAKRVLRLWSPQPRDTHIFLCARRREPFRWRFPPSIFHAAELLTIVRHPFIEMGVNDGIQCPTGWGSLEPGAEGNGPVRRVNSTWLRAGADAVALLRGIDGGRRVVVRLRVDADESDVACCRVTVRTRGDSSILLGSAEVPQRREWLDVEVTLARPTGDREELEVRIGFRSPAPVEVQRIRLER